MEYFKRRPIGWREDSRTHKIMQSFGTKAKGPEIFDSLRILQEESERENPSDGRITNSFKSSVMYRKILSAKGGEKIG